MSENEHTEPANLDLYQEQARQGVLLDGVCADVKEIKDCLIGRDSGLIVEVDRLKRGRTFVYAITWLVFTCVIGVALTAATQVFTGN